MSQNAREQKYIHMQYVYVYLSLFLSLPPAFLTVGSIHFLNYVLMFIFLQEKKTGTWDLQSHRFSSAHGKTATQY